MTEALRQRTVELTERLRRDPTVSPALWELLEALTARIEALEKRPVRHTSSGNFSAARVERILEEGRKDEEK
jgi:hypothetical protein